MFQEATSRAIFPTNIWLWDLAPEIGTRLNQQMIQDLDRITAPRPPLKPGANWQTDQNLHEMAEFAEISDYVRGAAREVLTGLEVEFDDTVITGCWANMSPPGGNHPAHIHPNNFLSAVYYLSTPPGGQIILFHDPRPQVEIMAPHYKHRNNRNVQIQQVQVAPGRLVMFPSWLAHSVPNNTGQGLRVSISFNLLLSAFTEKVAKPRWQGMPVSESQD